MSEPSAVTPERTEVITAKPRPTMAAVRTTQSTVTAPDSLATKVLIIEVKVMCRHLTFGCFLNSSKHIADG